MIWTGEGRFHFEKGEPEFGECWVCAGVGKREKKVNKVHCCTKCSRFWIFTKFLDRLETPEEVDRFFQKAGMSVGMSTTKVLDCEVEEEVETTQ